MPTSVVNIGAADHRQQIDLVASHALQGQVQPLIGVHVGKERRGDHVVEQPAGVLVHFDLHLRLSDDADDTALVRDQGRSQAAGADASQRLAHRDFGLQQKPRSFHDLRDRALIELQPRPGAGQMDAVLHGQRLVDGLMLQEGGDEEADQLAIIRGTMTA